MCPQYLPVTQWLKQVVERIELEIDKIPPWILALEQEDAAFLKNFVLKSGSLKEIARLSFFVRQIHRRTNNNFR